MGIKSPLYKVGDRVVTRDGKAGTVVKVRTTYMGVHSTYVALDNGHTRITADVHFTREVAPPAPAPTPAPETAPIAVVSSVRIANGAPVPPPMPARDHVAIALERLRDAPGGDRRPGHTHTGFECGAL